jgi:predicted nucleic acid-binding protein
MWSDDLLDEWERVIVRQRHRSPDAAAAITATIRQFFADTCIPVERYRGLIVEVDGPDPNDNAHMAAALAGQVEVLVTWNSKDFDCGFTKKHAMRIMDPNVYLCVLYRCLPSWSCGFDSRHPLSFTAAHHLDWLPIRLGLRGTCFYRLRNAAIISSVRGLPADSGPKAHSGQMASFEWSYGSKITPIDPPVLGQ